MFVLVTPMMNVGNENTLVHIHFQYMKTTER